MNKKLKVQITLVIATLCVYNYSLLNSFSPMQNEFVGWLNKIRPQLQQQALKSNPEIILELDSKLPKLFGNWRFTLQREAKDKEKKLKARRLLEMIEALELFNKKKHQGNAETLVTLSVISSEKNFKAKATREDISNNASLQAFLTLFTIYGTNTDD